MAAREIEIKQTIWEPEGAGAQSGLGRVFTLEKDFRGYIQNLGTNPLKVKLGGSNASNTSYHVILAGGTVNDDGRGDDLWIDDFVGNVSVYGTSPRYIAWRRQI
jgi:hypothetical protein